MEKFKPRVMLSKRGNILEIVETRGEWTFLKFWNFTDLGPL